MTTVSSDLNSNDDMQVTTEAQLGLIGGTMGLLTGLSILSGVEIVYYLFRFSQKIKKTIKEIGEITDQGQIDTWKKPNPETHVPAEDTDVL